jgi:hypothetical protein
LVIFGVRAYFGMPDANWVDALYGLIAAGLLTWALRPNIRKLFNGTERVVSISLHGRLKAKQEQREASDAVDDIE